MGGMFWFGERVVGRGNMAIPEFSAGVHWMAGLMVLYVAMFCGGMFVRAVWEWLRRVELEAVTWIEGVPSEPVCEEGLSGRAGFRHRWVETEEGGELIVPSREKRRVVMFGVFNGVLLFAIAMAMIWGTDPMFRFTGVALVMLFVIRGIATFFGLIWASVIGGLFYVMCGPQFATRFLVKRRDGICVIQDENRVEKIPLSEVRGVQLCLYRRKIGNQGQWVHWCVEINLVWEKSGEVLRRTVLLAGQNFGRVVREAGLMAAALGVPLIHNVAMEDYWKERERSKVRPGVSGGWGTY